MKKIFFCITIALLVSSISYCQEQPLKLTIRSDKDTYEARNSSIEVEFIFENISNKPIVLVCDYKPYDFEFFDINGTPLDSKGPQYAFLAYIPIGPRKLLPNEEFKDRVQLSDWKIGGSYVNSKARKILVKGIYANPSKIEKSEGVDVFQGSLISTNTITIDIVEKK